MVSVVGVGVARLSLNLVDSFFKKLADRDNAFLRLALDTPRSNVVLGNREERNELTGFGGFHRRAGKNVEELLFVAQREKLVSIKPEFLSNPPSDVLVGFCLEKRFAHLRRADEGLTILERHHRTAA